MEAGSEFRPTHTAPAGGLPTWSAPDPAAAADNRLDPLLEVQVMQETTGWAHILCANGWTAWVDSRYLVPLPTAAAPPAAGVAGAPPSFSPPSSAPPAPAAARSAAGRPPTEAGASPTGAGAPPSAAPAAAAVAAPATTASPGAVAAPKARRGGCGRIVLFGCLGLVLLTILGGAGIFIALRTGALTTDRLLNVIGQGPATIEVDNLRDDSMQVAVDSLSSSSSSGGSTSSSGSSGGSSPCGFSLSGGCVMLNPFDVKQRRVENPGKYKVTFVDKAGATIGTCTLNVHGGDDYQFVALPALIAVNRGNDPSKKGPDYDIKTSSLCQP